MKVFFTYQGVDKKYFYEFDVSSSITVSELIKFDAINDIISDLDHDLIIAVNSELLDGNFKPFPQKYRLKEIYNSKERDIPITAPSLSLYFQKT